MTWEEIFTSSNPAGGRMINVISGAAGSDASPYTANNPNGGRAINVNIVSGGAGTGFLQITGGVLDTTLRNVTDNSATPVVSPLQLSTTQVAVSTTIALAAGATNPRPFNVLYTINNSGAQTGTATGIFLNATETALNGMAHNLMDLQVGGSSKMSVNNLGAIAIGNTVAAAIGIASTHKVTIVIGGTTYYLLASDV
jgi:hypothetical protein